MKKISIFLLLLFLVFSCKKEETNIIDVAIINENSVEMEENVEDEFIENVEDWIYRKCRRLNWRRNNQYVSKIK